LFFCEIPAELYTHLEASIVLDREDKNLSVYAVHKATMPLTLGDKYAGSLQCNALTNDFEYYKKYLALTVESNIELFKQLPKPAHFDWEDLLAHMEIEIRKKLERNKIFEDTVELSKYAYSMLFSMDKFYQKIAMVSKQSKELNVQDIVGFSKDFLNSDLPDCFLAIVTRSFLVENDFSDFYQRHIDREKTKLIATKNNRLKFERLCETHNQWAKVFTKKVLEISRNRAKLVWYIDVNNSKTFDELFKEKQVSMANLDADILQHFMEIIERETNALELLLVDPELSRRFISIGETESVLTITKMINIIDS
jgi:hypothetical protein